MLTKSELMAIPLKIRDIKRARARLEKMRSKLYSPQGFDSRERVQTSGQQHDELADMVIDLEARLKAEEDKVAVLKQQAIEMFMALDAEGRQLMTLRYIGALSWGEIAEVMSYSLSTLFRRHRQILIGLYPEESEG